MGDGDTGVRWGRHTGGDSRHNLERNPSLLKRLRLLAPAAEDERIPALESDDALSLATHTHQQRVDRILARRFAAAAALAHLVHLDVRIHEPRRRDDRGVRQRIRRYCVA